MARIGRHLGVFALVAGLGCSDSGGGDSTTAAGAYAPTAGAGASTAASGGVPAQGGGATSPIATAGTGSPAGQAETVPGSGVQPSGTAGDSVPSPESTGTGGDLTAAPAAPTGAIQGSVTCGAPDPNPSAGNTCAGTAPPALKLTEVASGFSEPLLVTHAPNDPSRLFVVQRGGVIRLIKDGSLVPTPFLDISSLVNTGGLAGERGLLGMAFDPNYETTRRFWLDYSARGGNGDTTIAGFVANEDGDSADLNSQQVLLTVPQPDSFIGNHNGGMLAFGPDHCLYIAMGDGGGMDDQYRNGQDPNTALAGILRVDVDTYSEGTGAPGNMLGYPHLWSYGLRNPWRFSFDRETGDMYIGDVGQGAWEEVNVEPRGVGGRNYGWPAMEGTACASGNCSAFTAPVTAKPNSRSGNQSVIGGYVYRGSAIPGLVGRYLFADYNSRKIWSLIWEGDGQICDEYELTDQLATGGSISSFGEDAQGELYVVVYDRGQVFRIDPQ